MASSSSPSSTSITASSEQLGSSSSPPPPHRSLQSPELQAEFLQACRRVSGSAVASSGPPSPPTSPLSSPPISPLSSPGSTTSPCCDNRQARLSLSSPELLSELKDSRTRPLRPVPAHRGMTTVFSGRGRQAVGSTPSTQPANQKTSP